MTKPTAPFLLAVFVLIANAWLAAQRPIRVHVIPVTNAEGFVDVDSKRRSDSRADLIKHLEDDKTITLVEDAASADVVIDVLSSRHEKPTKPVALLGERPSDAAERLTPTIVARLSAGSYTREFRAELATVRWKDVASTLGRMIRNWIKDNRLQLLAKSPK